MTTIAANRSMMAGDSWVSCGGGGTSFRSQKIYRIDGSLFGLAGDNFSDLFLEWASEGFKPKSKPNLYPIWDQVDFVVLEVAEDGLAVWDKHLVRVRLKDDNYSVGSGASIALTLMRKHNVSPDQAVIECCEFDEYTKGPVDVLYLKEPSIAVPISKKVKKENER